MFNERDPAVVEGFRIAIAFGIAGIITLVLGLNRAAGLQKLTIIITRS